MRADDVGDDHQIPVRLKAHRQRPKHLGFVEHIDVVVDDDHMFDVWIGDQGSERGLLRFAFGSFLDRDVTVRAGGAGDRHVDAGGARHDFLDALEQAAQSRRGADDVVLEMGAMDALIDRIFPHGDRGDFDVGLLAFFIVVMRPLAEGAFVMALFRRHDAFDDDLGVAPAP